MWNIVGNANAMSVSEARKRASSMLCAVRLGADALPFESVADSVFRRYAQVWNANAPTIMIGKAAEFILSPTVVAASS